MKNGVAYKEMYTSTSNPTSSPERVLLDEPCGCSTPVLICKQWGEVNHMPWVQGWYNTIYIHPKTHREFNGIKSNKFLKLFDRAIASPNQNHKIKWCWVRNKYKYFWPNTMRHQEGRVVQDGDWSIFEILSFYSAPGTGNTFTAWGQKIFDSPRRIKKNLH